MCRKKLIWEATEAGVKIEGLHLAALIDFCAETRLWDNTETKCTFSVTMQMLWRQQKWISCVIPPCLQLFPPDFSKTSPGLDIYTPSSCQVLLPQSCVWLCACFFTLKFPFWNERSAACCLNARKWDAMLWFTSAQPSSSALSSKPRRLKGAWPALCLQMSPPPPARCVIVPVSL